MRVSVKSCWPAIVLAFAGAVASSGVALADDTRIADAAEHRDLKTITALLKTGGANVNAPQADGGTALHWAAHWNELPIAKALVAARADANAANEYGVTPLFLAATNGSAEMIGILVDAGANASAALPSGETALMTAVRSGNTAAVQRLLAAGADVKPAQKSKGQTALMWAATAQKPDVVRALLTAGADVHARTQSGFTPLLFAAREGNVDVVRLLLAAGADVNKAATDGATPLLIATMRSQINVALLLLEQGAKPDGDAASSFTPLHWACFRSETPITYSDAYPPGEWAATAGIADRAAKITLIKALLARGANVEAKVVKPIMTPLDAGGSVMPGATAFYVASVAGDAEVMRLLLAANAKADVRVPSGATPLMAAISGGNAFYARHVTEKDRIEAIKVLLETGADIEAQDNKGYRAMHLAASAEFQQIITFLLDKGAELNPVTKPRLETEGTGRVAIAGQSPLGITEGTFNGGTFASQPGTAEFLRKLGAKSIGKASLESYMKSFEELSKDPSKAAPAPR